MSRILMEICCGSADDVIQAEKGGADRVELNSNLFQGGLTPSIGMLEVVKRYVSIPVMTAVRTGWSLASCMKTARWTKSGRAKWYRCARESRRCFIVRWT